MHVQYTRIFILQANIFDDKFQSNFICTFVMITVELNLKLALLRYGSLRSGKEVTLNIWPKIIWFRQWNDNIYCKPNFLWKEWLYIVSISLREKLGFCFGISGGKDVRVARCHDLVICLLNRMTNQQRRPDSWQAITSYVWNFYPWITDVSLKRFIWCKAVVFAG